MLFKLSRDVPANTTAAAPDWQKLQIRKGQIKRWFILLPVECSNVMQLQIRYHGTQLIPISEDQYLYGGGFVFNLEDWIRIDDPPYELDIYAINSDTSETHEYNVYCNIKPPSPISPEELSPEIEEELEELMGE